MTQPAGFTKKLLSVNPFWERASEELPLDGIEFRSLLRDKPAVSVSPEPILEVEITGDTETQGKKRKLETKKNASNGKTDPRKPAKRVLCATQ